MILQKLLLNNPPVSHMLTVFGPFILDCLNAWEIRNRVLPLRCTDFSQRVQYFTFLRQMILGPASLAGVYEAVNSTLGNLLEIGLSCFACVAVMEMAHQERQSSVVSAVLQYIIPAELADPNLLQALTFIQHDRRTCHTSERYKTIQGQLSTRFFHSL